MINLIVLLLLSLLHIFPLLTGSGVVAGGPGDALAHAAIPSWFCDAIYHFNSFYAAYLAPFGISVSGNYDSPFPFALTCAVPVLSSIGKFHLFVFLQIFLILFSAHLLAAKLKLGGVLKWAFIVFLWFTGFYLSRLHFHYTLLSMVWGTLFMLYTLLDFNPSSLKNVLKHSLLIGLSLAGTFQNLGTVGLIGVVLFLVHFRNFGAIKNLIIGGICVVAIFAAAWGPTVQFTLRNVDPIFKAEGVRAKSNLTVAGALKPVFLSTPAALENTNTFDILLLLLFAVLLFQKQVRASTINRVFIGLILFYLFLSLGPEFKITGWLFDFYPFKAVRTPSRFAIVSVLTLTTFVFMNLHRLSFRPKMLAPFLFFWALVFGPVLNGWFVPVLDYNTVLPIKAMEAINQNASADSIVAVIPRRWAQEPLANFFQLFHKRPSTSAYLAYPVYNQELLDKTAADEFLGQLECANYPAPFRGSPLIKDFPALAAYLKEKKYNYLVVMKFHLADAACADLRSWAVKFLYSEYVEVTHEDPHFIVARIK